MGGDGDAVGASGILVADAEGVACGEDGVGQLVEGAPLRDPLCPALHREDREVEILIPRVAAGLAGHHEGDAAALVQKRGPDAPLFEAEAGAEVGQRMLEASAAQYTQQQRLVEALLGGQLCRVLGVGVVLDVGQDDGVVALLRRAGRGVEVAHDDVGTAVERPAVAVARVAGNDGIAGPQGRRQRGADRAGGNDNTAGHGIPSFLGIF